MIYRVLADAAVLAHFAFIAFVVFGGLLVLRWRALAWAHVPCVAWGVLIEYAGWICPLTPLENRLRRLGGEAGYAGGFIERYVTSVMYPEGLDRGTQILLGTGALLLNLIVYATLILRRRRHPARVD